MIRTEREYQESLRRLQEGQNAAEQQRAALVQSGLPPEDIELAMEPVLSFLGQIEEEVGWYEGAQRGQLAPITSLSQLGRLLIGLRIASDLTQRDLAERLGVAESQISRDERNDYYGVTADRAQRVLDVLLNTLGASFVAGVADARDSGLIRFEATTPPLRTTVQAEGRLNRDAAPSLPAVEPEVRQGGWRTTLSGEAQLKRGVDEPSRAATETERAPALV